MSENTDTQPGITEEEFKDILLQDLLMDTEEFNITPQKVRRILAANLEE